jgi:hypothetical protein
VCVCVMHVWVCGALGVGGVDAGSMHGGGPRNFSPPK